jgi:hypothetical protein
MVARAIRESGAAPPKPPEWTIDRRVRTVTDAGDDAAQGHVQLGVAGGAVAAVGDDEGVAHRQVGVALNERAEAVAGLLLPLDEEPDPHRRLAAKQAHDRDMHHHA